jgi:hypothetical protein
VDHEPKQLTRPRAAGSDLDEVDPTLCDDRFQKLEEVVFSAHSRPYRRG